MARSYKYVGPHDAVDVVGFGTVKRGDAVPVDSAQVEEFDARDDFEVVPAKKAATRGDDKQED